MAAASAKGEVRGRFITFEGIDGCGKTTQARLLAAWLRERGLSVLETREPGGTPIEEKVRAVLLHPDHEAMVPFCELMLYLADRLQHLEQVIRPALARGEVVICDRFHDATVAYQGHGRGLELAPLREFIAAEVMAPPPELTFWLDLDVDAAQRRIARRNRSAGKADAEGRLDGAALEFHERVRAGYAAIRAREPERVRRIDAAGDPQAIAAEIRALLEERYRVL